jgi:hypothetical protein
MVELSKKGGHLRGDRPCTFTRLVIFYVTPVAPSEVVCVQISCAMTYVE